MNCGIGNVLSSPSATKPRTEMKISERPKIRNRMVSTMLNTPKAEISTTSRMEDSVSLTSAQRGIRCVVNTLAIARVRRVVTRRVGAPSSFVGGRPCRCKAMQAERILFVRTPEVEAGAVGDAPALESSIATA